MAARAEQITGLVLAGGRGERVDGADKGWGEDTEARAA